MRNLLNTNVTTKPAYLFETKEDLIAERDNMEANWSNTMRDRMITLSKISLQKFGVSISELA